MAAVKSQEAGREAAVESADIYRSYQAIEGDVEKIRRLLFELKNRAGEVPRDKIRAYKQVLAAGEEIIDPNMFDEYFGYAEIVLKKIKEGVPVDAEDVEKLNSLHSSSRQEIAKFNQLYEEKGIGDLVKHKEDENVLQPASEKKPEPEKAALVAEPDKITIDQDSAKFDILRSKISDWSDTLDNLSFLILQLKEKTKLVKLSQKLLDEVAYVEKAQRYSIETNSEISDLVSEARKEKVINQNLSDRINKFEEHLKVFQKAIDNLYGRISSEEETIAAVRRAETEKQEKIDSRLSEIERRLNDFSPTDPDNKKLRDEILAQMPQLKAKKLDGTAIDNLEALVNNRIILPEKKQLAKEVRVKIRDGLKKYQPRLYELKDAFNEISITTSDKKTGIEIAWNLYQELDRDLKSIGPENVDEQNGKFNEFERQMSMVEKQFVGPLETEIIRKRVKKLLVILEAAKNNPDLQKIHKRRVDNLIEDIGTIKSVGQLGRVEEMVRQYISAPLSKKAHIRDKTEKAEKKFEEEGKAMGAFEKPAVEKAVKKGIKEILEEKGVVNIDPKEFIDKLRPEQLGEFAVCVLEKNNDGMEKILRDFVREVAPTVAAEQRETISREIRSTLSAAIEAEAQAEVAKLNNGELSKYAKAGQIGLKIAGNVGVAFGIGIGVASVVSSAGLAAVVTGGSIAAARLLNKYLGKKIVESEKYQKAKEKVTGVWQKVGKLFKKEELPVNADDVREKVILKFISQEKLAVLLSNQIRESTSVEMLNRIKEYPPHKDAALSSPSAENIAKFSEALDDATHNFYLNALNYVNAEYAKEDLSEEEKAKMAAMIAMTIGINERGEIEEEKQFKELRDKAKTPEDKHALVQKFEKLQKLRSEGIYSVGFGMAASYAVRSSMTGKIVSGALGGIAVGLLAEKWTRGDVAVKTEKAIDKMISDTEKKIAGKEMGQLSEKDMKKAVENAADIQSQIDIGVLDNNPILKKRAEGFIFRVRATQFEMIEAKSPVVDKIIEAIQKNTDRYEKQNKKSLDKLKFFSPKQRQLLFMAGGALAGAALGAAGAFLSDYFRAPKPEEITPTEIPLEEVKPHAPSITPFEAAPKTDEGMVFTEEDVAKYQAELDAAKKAVKHAAQAHPGIASLRTHHVPTEFGDIKKVVGVDTAEWVQFLDKNNYHKISQDLFNAKVNLTEYGARAADNAAMIEKSAILSERFDEAQDMLKDHRYAEAAKIFRDISRATLHEKERFFETGFEKPLPVVPERLPVAPLPSPDEVNPSVTVPEVKMPPLYREEEIWPDEKPAGAPAAEQELEGPPKPSATEQNGPTIEEADTKMEAELFSKQDKIIESLKQSGSEHNRNLADRILDLRQRIYDNHEALVSGRRQGHFADDAYADMLSHSHVLKQDFNQAVELVGQGKGEEAGRIFAEVNQNTSDLNQEMAGAFVATDQVVATAGAEAETAQAGSTSTTGGEAAHTTEKPAPEKPATSPEAEERTADEIEKEETEQAEQEETEAEEESVEEVRAQMEQLTHLPKAQQKSYFWLTNEISAHPDNESLQKLKDRFIDEMMEKDKPGLAKVVREIEVLRKK